MFSEKIISKNFKTNRKWVKTQQNSRKTQGFLGSKLKEFVKTQFVGQSNRCGIGSRYFLLDSRRFTSYSYYFALWHHG